MNISGLANDFYLSNNDIWVVVNGTASPAKYLDVIYRNETTGESLPALRPYPNLQNEFRFNISMPIRALFPDPDHVTVNTLQRITIQMTATLEDGSTENLNVLRNFIRGGRDKQNVDEWYLETGQSLKVGRWPKWRGVDLPTGAYKLQGNMIVEYIPNDTVEILNPNICNAAIIKFLNRLGAYQYWIFESITKLDDSKGLKSKTEPSYRLRQNVSRQLGVTKSRQVVFRSRVPMEFEELIEDLIGSVDILIYDPRGTDNDSRWLRVGLAGTNKLERNNTTKIIDAEVTFDLPEYVTRDL